MLAKRKMLGNIKFVGESGERRGGEGLGLLLVMEGVGWSLRLVNGRLCVFLCECKCFLPWLGLCFRRTVKR